jgi:uncharacterized protein
MFLERGRNLSGAGHLHLRVNGRVVATDVELAITREQRNKGLLGRDHLPAGHALIIAPCTSIHTWFMRFPIDVLFVKRDGQIVKISTAVPAWRFRIGFGAFAVVEMPAGAAAQAGLQARDVLDLS